MCSSPSGSTELTADVNSTVGYLKDLGSDIESGNVNFTTEELQSLMWLSDILKQTDKRRNKLHELLEACTISASVLRHRLGTFPKKVENELSDALYSARCSDAAQIETLQMRLTDFISASSEVEKKKEVLDLHNDVLQPAHSKLSLRHKTLVEKINNLLTKRAVARIALNETHDRLKMTNAKTEEFKSDLMKLQQENDMYRENFQVEKQALLVALEKTRSLCATKTEESQKLAKECKMLGNDVTEVTTYMETRQQTLRDIEIEVQQQLHLEEQLQATQKQKEHRFQRIKHMSVQIKQQHMVTQEELQKKENMTKGQTNQFLSEVEHIDDQVKELAVIKRSLCKDLKRVQDSKDRHHISVTSTQESVATLKHTLQFQAEEGAKLEDDNQELEFRLTKVLESHQVTVHLCKDKMRKLQENLSKEKKAGETVEEVYLNMQITFSSQENKLAHTTSLLASSLKTTSLQCDTLSQTLSTLESQFHALEECTLYLKGALLTAKSDLETVSNQLQHMIETLQEKNFHLQTSGLERMNTLQVLKPIVIALEGEHREKSTMYESQKKTVIALKNKRSGLQEKTNRWQQQLEHMEEPQDKLRLATLRQRTYTREKLKEQTKEVECIEHEVVLAYQQLTAVDKENKRIHQMMCSTAHECAYLEKLLVDAQSVEERLTSELGRTRDILKLQWSENWRMEKECTERDKHLVEKFASLHEQSRKIEQETCHAHSEFEKRLQTFSHFLTAMEVEQR